MKRLKLIQLGLIAIALAASGQAQDLKIGLSAPYAFDMEQFGVSLEGGSFLNSHTYLGMQVTHFAPDETDTFDGLPVFSEQKLTTALFLYRYHWPVAAPARVSYYAGIGLGASWVKLESSFPAVGINVSDKSNGDLSGELQVGVEYQWTERVSIRLGYRYLRIMDVELFGAKDDIDDNIAEAGLSFRF